MTEPKGQVVGKVAGCKIITVVDSEGKEHFEATCLSKEARDKLAAIFEQEAILRVNPKAILEEPAPEPVTDPVTEPVTEPATEPVTEPGPDTRLNPTES